MQCVACVVKWSITCHIH